MEPADFEILGPIRDVEVIAAGRSIKELPRVVRDYGRGRWRKMKGLALIRAFDGYLGEAEIHWYEAHGIGRCDWKIKQKLE